MRFLCLHGLGTSAKIFESQTAALRYELGDNHEFHFIEGSVPSDPAPEIASLSNPDDQFYSWFDPSDPACAEVAERGLSEMDDEIASEGPFDGVMAFSEGAAVAATYMLSKTRADPLGQRLNPVFRCAIFFSGLPPGDLEALEREGTWRALNVESEDGGGDAEGKPLIAVPTLNVWDPNDASYPGCGEALHRLCEETLRETVTHDGGHEIPGTRDKRALKATVAAIRKTIERALLRQ